MLRLANGMANPSVCVSVVCNVTNVCEPYSGGLTFLISKAGSPFIRRR